MSSTGVVDIYFADSPYEVSLTDQLIIAHTDGGVIEVNLPPAADVPAGEGFHIKRVGDNNVNINADGVDSIFTDTDLSTLSITTDGTSYYLVRSVEPSGSGHEWVVI
jgi:hypothetical protein